MPEETQGNSVKNSSYTDMKVTIKKSFCMYLQQNYNVGKQ